MQDAKAEDQKFAGCLLMCRKHVPQAKEINTSNKF